MKTRTILVAILISVLCLCSVTGAQAALLGLQGRLTYPLISYNNRSLTSTSYLATSKTLTVTTTPSSLLVTSADTPVSFTAPTQLSIQAPIDNTGAIIAATATDRDLVLTGTVTVNGTVYSGTSTSPLLTGKSAAFGFLDQGSSDTYELTFNVTGGLLKDAQLITGIVGVLLTSETSTFANNFGVNFNGKSKGTMGVMPAPIIKVEQTCTDASAPGQPMTFTVTLINSGNEQLSGITCLDAQGSTIAGLPATIAANAAPISVSLSYTPATTPFSQTITCSATGAVSTRTVSADSSASCNIITNPGFKIQETCTHAAAPGEPITISGLITNTGNETLTEFSCSDTRGPLTGIPTTLAPGATAALSGSYVPTESSSTDTITCSAKGSTSNTSVSADASATCGIETRPAMTVSEGCTNAAAPGQSINITATLTNSGNETLTGVTCSDSKGTLTGVPTTLAPGVSATLTASYVPTASGSTDTITCSASGAINSAPVSATSSATCDIVTAPALTVAETCSNASAPGQPIAISALITNSGNETLTGFSCTDSSGATLTGVPTTLAANATATVTGSYVPTASGSTDTITCSANGAINSAHVSATSSATCDIVTAPALTVAETCSNASAPGQPIGISVLITNSGNEPLTGFSCTDSRGATLSGVPTTLAANATATVTGSYVPTASGSIDTITCSASGAINSVPVSATSSATCNIVTAPALAIAATCSNASAPGQPINISATLTNTGNETLSGFNCTDSQGALLAGVPAILAPGATAPLTGSYVPTTSGSTDTISCSAGGVINGASVSANSSTTCDIEAIACIQIKKQVSTNCTVTGGKDKHCKTDESKEDHCRGGDADRAYCADATRTKQIHCREVTQKQAHCGSSETKSSHCSKSDCDRGYCDRKDSKDDYCKIPAAPICVPVWLDADTQDTAATMVGSTGSTSDSGDDLLTKLSSGTYSNDRSATWLKKLKHAVSKESSEDGDVHDADRDDDDDKPDDDDKYDSSDYYQGHVRQSGLVYRFTVTNCGSADLTSVLINDARIGISNYPVGALKPGETVTLNSEQIPQLAQPKLFCSDSFVNTATATGTDPLGRPVSASDDAWVLCNTKSCVFTQGYWKNHPGNWPVTTLKLGSVSYTQNQLLSIFRTPVSGNGLIALSHQLIAAKLNLANGTLVPAAVQQAIVSADALIGALTVPPVGSGSLDPALTAAFTQTLDSYNNGTLAGGPKHCGDTAPPQQCTGVIGDFVWNDLNKNGGQNTGEPGLAGVKVTLSNGKSTTTDASGHYQFTGLCQGSYLVKATPPGNMVATTASSVNVSLGTNASNLSADFGFAKPALDCSGKIGDFIWDDANRNGIQDSTEPGLSGVTLTLSNGTKAVSDASGRYQFTGLCAGEYTVTVATPGGYTASPVAQGSNPAKDSKGMPAKVTLTANNSSVQNIDFGFYETTAPACTGVIGNFVWNDLNKNGIQDCSEKGIAGVVLKLSSGQSVITDADGHYQFAGLCAGAYEVTVTTPDGFTLSPTRQGSSRAADSNGSPATVTLGDNRASDQSVDFGFWKLPTPTSTQAKGCSLGYWKNHTANWPVDYHTFDNFDTIFGTNAFSPDITLLQALSSEGGGLYNLARQGAAALLNARDERITGFPLSVSQVKAAVLNAILDGDYDSLAKKLDSYNNLGCPLN